MPVIVELKEEANKAVAPVSPRIRAVSHSSGTSSRQFVGDEMDQYLMSLGLVKKYAPRDGSSIYRAVCEQLGNNQCDHVELRRLTETLLAHQYKVAKIRDPSAQWDREKEILKILANITKSEIIVYRKVKEEPTRISCADQEEGRSISICEVKPSHYEQVYSLALHEASAIAQSLVYRCLYEGVFKESKEDIDKAIDLIRKDIDQPLPPGAKAYPKFPYRAVKSLDPSIYRNIDFDVYVRERKLEQEKRQRAIMNSCAVKFSVGSRCMARDGGQVKNARVIEVLDVERRRIEFEDGAGVREVSVTDLRVCQPGPGPLVQVKMFPMNGPNPLDTRHPPPLNSPMAPPAVPPNTAVGPMPFVGFPPPPGGVFPMGPQTMFAYPPPPISAPPVPTGPVFTFDIRRPPPPQHPPNFSTPPPYVNESGLTWYRPIPKQRRATISEIPYNQMPPMQYQQPPPHNLEIPSLMNLPVEPPMGVNGRGCFGGVSEISEGFPPRMSESDTVFSGGDEHYVQMPFSPIPENDIDISDPFMREEQLQQVNTQALYSQFDDGSDLPQDVPTLRFFYNMGVKFFRNNISHEEGGELDPAHQLSPPPASSVPQPMFDPNMPYGMMMVNPTPPNMGGPVYANTPIFMQQPYLAQYMIPNIDGMPTMAQMMEQAPPSMGTPGWTPVGGTVFFPATSTPIHP